MCVIILYRLIVVFLHTLGNIFHMGVSHIQHEVEQKGKTERFFSHQLPQNENVNITFQQVFIENHKNNI